MKRHGLNSETIVEIGRTDYNSKDFHLLVEELDRALYQRYGDSRLQYNAFNKTDSMNGVVIASIDRKPVGCGAIRKYSPDTMEIKRMFVSEKERKKGIAAMVLNELENWTKELGFSSCILITGEELPEAIRLYEKNGYTRIPNFGQYNNDPNSVCFAKELSIPQSVEASLRHARKQHL